MQNASFFTTHYTTMPSSVKTIFITDPTAARPNPVNPLGAQTRLYLAKSIQSAIDDAKVTSIILTGTGTNFSAGADIREFSLPATEVTQSTTVGDEVIPSLVDLCNLIENSSKPIVAAICGACLGGGLELALSCHYRVCPSPTSAAGGKTKMGLPEVNIGLIPGAGGTQRLPRLCDLVWSLKTITTGRMIGVSEALKVGLIDAVAGSGTAPSTDESLLDCAARWAMYGEVMPTTGRMLSRRQLKGDKAALAALCDKAAKKLPRVEKGGEAVLAAVQAIRASFVPYDATFEGGMATEAEIFTKLLVESSQGRGRRHAFFAERAAAQSSGKPSAAAAAAVKGMLSNPSNTPVGVIGAGTMGSGIALTLLRAGYAPVVLIDNNAKGLERGVALIQKLIKGDVAKRRLSPKVAQAMGAALMPSTDLNALSRCKFIIEAAFESLEIKKEIFGKLNGIAPADAYLCSNTSTLDIDAIASALSPARRPYCAGMHFFSPAHVMKLVEIVQGAETSSETLAVISAVTKKIKKVGVTVGNCDGFVGNRMLNPYTSEMLFVVEGGGASVMQVDAAISKFGMAIGPFLMSDLAGNDIGYKISLARGLAKDPKTGLPGPNRKEGMRWTDLGGDLVADLGRVGQKAGKGWYTYDKRVGKGRMPMPSSEVAALIARFTAKSSSPDEGRKLKNEEIVERLLYPLVNEGFKILEEGIARDPADIDVIYIYGYGWPVWRGGPMFWVDNEVGLPTLLAKLEEFHKRYPSEYYAPSKLLKTCVALDVGVQEYYRKGMHKGGDAARKAKL